MYQPQGQSFFGDTSLVALEFKFQYECCLSILSTFFSRFLPKDWATR
jgi:hypothetical protein